MIELLQSCKYCQLWLQQDPPLVTLDELMNKIMGNAIVGTYLYDPEIFGLFAVGIQKGLDAAGLRAIEKR